MRLWTKYLPFVKYTEVKRDLYSLTLFAHVRLLKPFPVIVINSFTVPVDGLMLFIDGEKHPESSNRNLSVFLTLVSFKSHRGFVARQPATELSKCKFIGPPLDKRTVCKSWIIF